MSGQLFIVSAPSGAGKTSLVKALVATDLAVSLSVSHTTRTARPGEVEGEDYHFVSPDVFSDMREAGAFLESATVFDNSYGTSQAAVKSQLAAGQDVILEIDWQGAEQVRHNYKDSISLFILPPSKAALESRLQGRGQDDAATIARRMQDARAEMMHYGVFDYLLVNDDFDAALVEFQGVVAAQRLVMSRQVIAQRELLQGLLA